MILRIFLSVSIKLSYVGIKIIFGPFDNHSNKYYITKLGAHGRSSIILCMRLCTMVILVFLPFHHPSVGSVSVLEAYLNPELDHLRVLR